MYGRTFGKYKVGKNVRKSNSGKCRKSGRVYEGNLVSKRIRW